MKNKNNIPCKTCICLPACISKYKKYKNEGEMWPAAYLDDCEIFNDIYDELDNRSSVAHDNYLDKWWKENYGKQK